MTQSKVIFKGVFWTIVQNVVSILYGIVSVPILINYFGKEEYGLISLAISVNLYAQLMDLGMTSTNVRFFSEFLAKGDNIKLQKLFSTTRIFYLSIGAINSLVLFIVSIFSGMLFNVSPEQAIILRRLLIILGLNAIFSWISECYDQFLRAHELIYWIKKRSTIIKLAQFIVLGATLLFKLSIETYFFMYVFLLTLMLPVTLTKSRHIAPNIKIQYKFDSETFREIFPFAISIFSFSIFQFLTYNSRSIFLGAISGPEAVAEFGVMNSIAMVVTVISSSISQVLIPSITKMKVANNNGVPALIISGTKYLSTALLIVVFLLVLSSREILLLYVGNDFLAIQKWLVLWLVTLLLSHRNVMTSLVFTMNQIRSVIWASFIAMILAILSFIIFIPELGVGGVVIGFTIHELVHTIFYYSYFMPRKIGINTLHIFKTSFLKEFVLLGIETVCIFFLFSRINCGSALSTLLIKTCISVILYVPTVWLAILNYEERLKIKSLLKIRQ